MANVFNLALPTGSSIPAGLNPSKGSAGVEFINNIGLVRTQAGVDANSICDLDVSPVLSAGGKHKMTLYVDDAAGGSGESFGMYFRYGGSASETWYFSVMLFEAQPKVKVFKRSSTEDNITEEISVAAPQVGDVITIETVLSGSDITILYNDSPIYSVSDGFNQTTEGGYFFTKTNAVAISELNYNQALTNTAPTASLGANQNITTGIEFTADASGSNDPDGDTLTYSYVLTTPNGSSATLADETTAAPRFTPDIDGEYTLTLTVNDGTANSSPVTQVLTAYTAGQAITMNADFISVIGNAVTLQCALSGEVTASSWSITQAPTGSTATISNPNANPATFTPDVIGLYEATMTATTSSGTEVDSYFFRVGDSLENGTPTATIETNGETLIGEKITLIAKGAY